MKQNDILIPKILTTFKEGYSWNRFLHDLSAGVVVGLVALPLSIAFGIASGVTPQQGIYTAIIGGFLISLFSGSRVQIGGPTGAFIVIVYGIVQQYGYEGLVVATIMAGVILILMGLVHFGRVIEYVPYPVTIGFTSGIAVIIFIFQLNDFLGLSLQHVPVEFFSKMTMIWSHGLETNLWSLGLGIFTVVTILQCPKYLKRIPGSVVAIVLATIAVSVFHLPVETIQSRFGDVPQGFPAFRIPIVEWSMIVNLIRPATTIALLAGLESLLSAVVADGMTGYRHRSSMELIAQGIGNIGSVFFGGIPVTGAIARTATNIKNGGRTPIAGIVHAGTLLLILVFFGRWAMLIPMPVLAGILIVVAYHMCEWRMFLKIFKTPKSDVLVLLTTFSLTILVDLTVAIEVGMVLAAFLFMKRMVDATQILSPGKLLQSEESLEGVNDVARASASQSIEIFEINGPFFFGAASKFKTVLNDIHKDCRVLILCMRNVPMMDATGLRALEDIIEKSLKRGMVVIFSEVQIQPRQIFESSGLDKIIGIENFLPNMQDALQKAKEWVLG